MIASGWEQYAQTWQASKFPVLSGHQVKYIGDEWTAEEAIPENSTNYGLPPEVVQHFDAYMTQKLLDPYLPSSAVEGMEIGPGGGRFTQLLLPRTQVLHVVDSSETMLQHLRTRFADVPALRYHHTDGMSLPSLTPASLDYVFAFDVFVHFEPRLFFWYLRQIAVLLKPGGIGIIHYANLLTTLGWKQFEIDLPHNLTSRKLFTTFGTMCPPIMAKFLGSLRLKTISCDIELIPRDAVAIFQRSEQ